MLLNERPPRKAARKRSKWMLNLFTSALITIVLYYLILVWIYLSIKLNRFHDPSNNLFDDYRAEQHSHEDISSLSIFLANSTVPQQQQTIQVTNDLRRILESLNRLLIYANNEEYDFFVCYRSLHSILVSRATKLAHNEFDICLYDKQSASLVSKVNFGKYFFKSDFDTILADLRSQLIGIQYSFSTLLGYYEIRLGGSRLFVYNFIHSAPNKYEFDTLVRSGVIYNQFNTIINKQLIKERLTSDDLMAHDSLFRPPRLPIYMVDGLRRNQVAFYEEKTKRQVLSIAFPNDALVMLMYLYPNNLCNNRHSFD